MTIHTYLPQDRLRAIANNTALPDLTSGSALFADISGFTLLTELLRNTHGDRRGEEELTNQLGAVYTALITEIEKFCGSVISFAGDSMLCWFDVSQRAGDQGAAKRALNAAIGMQAAMKSFEKIKIDNETVALSLKVAIATGPARRFVVGDPEILKLDVLAGDTITRTATAEHHAKKGEVLLDEATVNALGDYVQVKEWREEAQEKIAVVNGVSVEGEEAPLPSILRMPPPDKLMAWTHSAVFKREQYGRGGFLSEFRPCVALFIRFIGINYDSESAESELDTFVSEVQRIVSSYIGTLMDITIGDKGSYVYVNFGALSAHEDNARRAVKTALELRDKTELSLQMGITRGLMRVGAYGGETRKVFGALGDDVNLAARLMMTAGENEILLSSHMYEAVHDDFTFEPRPPLLMKGKAESLPVFVVTGESQKRAVRLQEPTYSLPMVGRQAELKLIEEKLDLAKEGRSQVIGIVAEAGLGKSRLVAEVIRSAKRKGFVGFGGACQSDGIHTPYLAWKSIWGAFFDVDPEMPEKKLMRWLEGEIKDRAPSRLDAMPLLNVVLDLNIPENEFTMDIDPKTRQSMLHALFKDCLKAQAGDEPTLIVIEDLHWIDALSHDLLEQLANALETHALCFILAYRPPQLGRLQEPRIEALEQFTHIELYELTKTEAESVVRAKLMQLYPARGGALPGGLVEALMRRAQGNPFFLEELLNYVRDRGLDPADIQNLELPDSLHTLILSRIDQLSETEKTTLRAASILGRRFRADWLAGYYPELGSFPQVKATLDELDKLEITLLDSEHKLTYLFKHIVTHEVTYESLPFSTRAKLHEQLAGYLENEIEAGATQNASKGYALPFLDVVTYHYLRSENQAKQIEYLRKAGEAAQKNYANEDALEFYGKLLPLLKDAREEAKTYFMRGQVFVLIGEVDKAESDYRIALEQAKDDLALKARVYYALGMLHYWRGNDESALKLLEQVKETQMRLENTAGLAQVSISMGEVLWRKGEYEQAREELNEGLAFAREAKDRLNITRALHYLGNVISWDQEDDITASIGQFEESLALRREIGDKSGIGSTLISLGVLALGQGDISVAKALYEDAQALWLETGSKWGIALAQASLGEVAYRQGDYASARALFEESLVYLKELDAKIFIAWVLFSLGLLDLAEDKPEAREHILHSLRLNVEMGTQEDQTWSLVGAAGLVLHEGDPKFAAQLLGTVESMLERLDKSGGPRHKTLDYEGTLAKTKDALGDKAFHSAFDEGSNWSLDETVKKVLDDDK